MQMPTIQMTREDAADQLRDYRRALSARKVSERVLEDRLTMRALWAVARGKRVISLREVFAACPVDEKHRPKVAVVRADAKTCVWSRESRSWVFTHGEAYYHARGKNQRASVRLEVPALSWTGDSPTRASAVVPSIPPWLRPAPEKMADYHLLFEADWKDLPPDPALLKRLTGDLFVVLAQWNLSPIERAVLADARVAR